MRACRPLVAVVAGTVDLVDAGRGRSVDAQVADAASVLHAARDALGGDTRIDAVRTLIVTGRTRQVPRRQPGAD